MPTELWCLGGSKEIHEAAFESQNVHEHNIVNQVYFRFFFFFNVHKQGGKAGAKGLALLSLEILPSAPLLLLLATA